MLMVNFTVSKIVSMDNFSGVLEPACTDGGGGEGGSLCAFLSNWVFSDITLVS